MIAGIISLYAGAVAPSGYLVCDGSAVSRAAYSTLFEAIGTTYGSGDGSTTFNLPDLSGRVAIGASSSHAIGTSGGEETHELADGELSAHTHEVPAHGHANTITATTPSISHTVGQPAYNYGRPGDWKFVYNGSTGGFMNTTTNTASRTTDITVANHPASDCTMSGGVSDASAFDTGSAGSSVVQAHNNMQPFITMLYIISTGVE